MPFKHYISCMGDSLTHNFVYSVPVSSTWCAQLQTSLKKIGCNVGVRNFGRAGNTTTQMVSRMDSTTQFGVPDIGIIFGGVNDPGSSITQTTTQSNLSSMISTLQTKGCNKIIVVSAHFLNYSVNGDYDSNNVLHTDTNAYYASVIAAQKAAVTAVNNSNVVYSDLFNYLRNRIVNGQDTLKSGSWHINPTNQHFNAYGWGLVANCVLATIQSQGWDSLLK